MRVVARAVVYVGSVGAHARTPQGARAYDCRDSDVAGACGSVGVNACVWCAHAFVRMGAAACGWGMMSGGG